MKRPISKLETEAQLVDGVLGQMNAVMANGQVMQGLVNRRSREKDVFQQIKPVFPELSPEADLATAQKFAALNLLLERESSGGVDTGLESIGDTVGRYHIKKSNAEKIDPAIADMTSAEYKTYIKNNPDKEEALVAAFIDTEIASVMERKGIDVSKLNPNEYAAVVSNLYTSTDQPKLLEKTADLTYFRGKAFPERTATKPEVQPDMSISSETANTNDQYIDQPGEIQDTVETEPPTLPTPKPERESVDVASATKEKSDKGFLETIKPFVPIYRHLNEGGMAKQMELFEDGGLKDEGGTVDPVSGNEVPPGSTQEEVRDDIPAQLSEGEFVIPADVVRYIGLGNLMQMRQEAKLGLKLMEEMGQMGNSEEATMPDDLPFDINDLDIEDEAEYNVGGFVPATQQQQQFGISGFQQAAAPTTGVAQAPVQAASQQFVQPMVRPQQAAVPTMQQYKPADIPTFQQTIGQTPGQYDELRTYKNEAGMTMQIPFKNGQPIYPIPEGYKYVDPEATKTEDVKTTPTTPQTTTVTQREEDPTEPVDPVKMQRMKDRIQAARDLGYLGADEFTNAGFFAGLTGKGEAGTVTGVGYVLDGKGNLFDPLNGHIVNTNIVSAISRDFDEFRLSQNVKNSLRSAEAQKTEFGKDMYNRIVQKGIDDRFDDYMKQAIDSGGSESENAAARQYVMSVKEEVEEQAKKGNVGTDGRIINPAETARGKVSVKGRGEDSPSAARDYARSLAKMPLTDPDSIPSTSYATSRRQTKDAVLTDPRDIPSTLPRPGGSGRGEDSPSAARDYARSRAAEESRMQQRQTNLPPTRSPERGEGSMDAARSYSMNRGPSDAYSGRSGGFSLARAEGGLINKPKPKAKKKMKRGGLASKK